MDKLYEISGRYQAALDSLTDNPDIPEDAIRDTLEGLEGEFEEKAIAVAAAIKNLAAESAAIDKAIHDIQRLLKAN